MEQYLRRTITKGIQHFLPEEEREHKRISRDAQWIGGKEPEGI